MISSVAPAAGLTGRRAIVLKEYPLKRFCRCGACSCYLYRGSFLEAGRWPSWLARAATESRNLEPHCRGQLTSA